MSNALKQPQDAQVMTTGGQQGFPAQNSAVPDSNTLLAYKLLSDSWGDKNTDPFKPLLRNELKYLMTGISMLENDPYLQLKLGGVTLNNAGFLANAVKQKASELDLRERIEPAAKKLLLHEYSPANLRELAPGLRSSVTLAKGNLGYFGQRDEEYQMGKKLTGNYNVQEFAGIFASDFSN